jgi:hypothetical protein
MSRGTVFTLTPPAQPGQVWTESVLYSFTDETDGANPQGGLVFDGSGYLYGTSWSNRLNYTGMVFQLTPPAVAGAAWTESTIHFFVEADGSDPAGSLIMDRGGILYGTTLSGGNQQTIQTPQDVRIPIQRQLRRTAVPTP